VFDGCAPSGRASAGGFRFAILAQRKRPAVHGRPPAGLIRPKPFAFARSAPAGPRPLCPPLPKGAVREGRAQQRHATRRTELHGVGGQSHDSDPAAPLIARLSVHAPPPHGSRVGVPRAVQSRGPWASSATCGTERCGRKGPEGGRHKPSVFAKAAGRLENPRPQRGRAGAQPSKTAAKRPPYPSAGETGATRPMAPGSCDHPRASEQKKDRRGGLFFRSPLLVD